MARIIALDTPNRTALWRVTSDDATPTDAGQPDLTVSDSAPAQSFPARLAGLGPLRGDAGYLPALARLLTLGAVAENPNWDGIVLVILSPHAHWTHVSAGEAISALATVTPTLVQALGADGLLDQPAMEEIMSRPERLTSALAADPDHALSHLVGADLAAARRWWLGHQLRLVGDGALADAFADALMTQGAPVARTDIATATRCGLMALAT
ncbi:2-dehydro-3-deoxygalactonokinase [Lutimaribacter sp. EGI FJ00015]|uniref:2-dehydro-3-deoxygalactonokinase n=1 Tax=Lutimaribacter degradans TaxID=2945989 RepID=A0ACC5ZZC6_9RHOB|nr:2-dehydro-3-deoxygalactonokinase [Lutimaribacter sp. EGI FJ00013]MCM2563397.1 2-dehydro-3-deoxygalactonokinase [Lutimaribacter sp. EGI FJ00013]MCO0614524.1 2-dehydro-3-deoxygalactonokinase [Lutimaribacter sp. EGI FJ00015]MCO0637197.1 2-dehydro-3-deoxygalactonokinase [Lutimaribacter sp. EGI FJ00014]